jgi:hypothetical protein
MWLQPLHCHASEPPVTLSQSDAAVLPQILRSEIQPEVKADVQPEAQLDVQPDVQPDVQAAAQVLLLLAVCVGRTPLLPAGPAS